MISSLTNYRCFREESHIPEIYNYDFDNNEKPWEKNGKQDMDKYFNYGFNEETWRHHARDAQLLAKTLPHLKDIGASSIRAQTNAYKKNEFLNFLLPHQFGGFGDPTQPRTINVTTSVEVPKIDGAQPIEETLSESTMIVGSTWGKMKASAMKDDYKETFVSTLSSTEAKLSLPNFN